MNRLLHIIILLFTTITATAQYDQHHSWGILQETQFRTGKSNVEAPDNFQGSIYYDDNFTPGKIMIEGEEENAFLRYNAYQGMFEVKREYTDDDFLLLNKDKNVELQYMGDRYVVRDFVDKDGLRVNGYLKVLEDYTDDAVLGVHMVKTYKPAQEPVNSYGRRKPATMNDEVYLVYINDKGKSTVFENSRRSILRAFDEDKRTLKRFIRKNDIDFDDNFRGATQVIREQRS